MAKEQFKTESKKLLDMMINSIYTHKEVFLRELISNASDACDKLRFRSLTDDSVKIPLDGYEIRLTVDKDARTITIKDNGCGMTAEDLEKNLGTIAKSGSFDFKAEHANDETGAAAEAAAEAGKDAGAESAKAAEAGAGKEAGAECAETDKAEMDDDTAAKEKNVDIIGQFGVGFYSAFMVSDCITVVSRAYGEPESSGTRWQSKGVDGYTIEPAENAEPGTTITLHMKEDTDTENYSEFLDEWRIRELIKKYSDYIHYPIRMMVTKSRRVEKPEEAENQTEASAENETPEYEDYQEDETLNSMIPIWKRAQSEVSDEEYATFYKDKFYDYEDPLKVIRQKSEGDCEFVSLMFIPANAPYNYYSREFEKGLQLYSSGVLIMDKCKDVIPDYFSFVRGLVDSSDLTLNISRETLQHDRQLKIIAKAIEKKVAAELKKMLGADREKYEKFFAAFGTQLKYGIYSDYGMHKDVLKDLIMFKSSFDTAAAETAEKNDADDKKAYIPTLATLAEYVSRMPEGQKKIYYAAGESIDAMKLLPQVEAVTGKGYEVLFLTEDVDEFALKVMRTYEGKRNAQKSEGEADKAAEETETFEFANVCQDDLGLETESEKKGTEKENKNAAEMFAFMKEKIGEGVCAVKFTTTLGKHPACISSDGDISANMEKTLSKMPGAEATPKAKYTLDINLNHPIAERLKTLYDSDKNQLEKYTKILYAQARLTSGMQIENAAEISDLVCELMTK